MFLTALRVYSEVVESRYENGYDFHSSRAKRLSFSPLEFPIVLYTRGLKYNYTFTSCGP